jgi:RNA polymerase sigma-70 factor (ECF subfamily)
MARAAPSETTDASLVDAALTGSFDAFEQLMRRYERKAFWIAFHVLGRVEESRDVVQEAFVRVYKSLDRFDFSKSFYTWLYRIVTNLAIDSLRRIRSEHTTELIEDDGLAGPDMAADGGPGQNLENDELRQTVRGVLDQIPPKFRTILALRDLHGIPCREIAPIVGLTYATVRWRLHKARQLFRESWERATRRWQE